MATETQYLCAHCQHDIDDHRPVYDYGQKDRCTGIDIHDCSDCKGHTCTCDGFTIFVTRDSIAVEEKIL